MSKSVRFKEDDDEEIDAEYKPKLFGAWLNYKC